MTEPPLVTVIVTAQREGRLAHATLHCLRRARQLAEETGIAVELLVVLNRPDTATQEYFQRFHDEVEVCVLPEDDLALARNSAVAHARGRFVTFLAAGDLWSSRWIVQAVRAAQQHAGPCVWHPSHSVWFDACNRVLHHPSSDDAGFPFLGLLQHDYWTSSVLAERQLLLDRPFPPAAFHAGDAPALRPWFCDLLADHIPVRVVKETALFLRVREPSPSESNNDQILPACRLFAPDELNTRLAGTPRRVFQPAKSTWLRSLSQASRRWAWRMTTHYPRTKSVIKLTLQTALDVLRTLQRWPGDLVRQLQRDTIPLWLREEWKAVHQFEPLLFPEPALVHSLSPERLGNASIADAYADLCERAGPRPSHVLLVPWLVKAGADLEVLNYVQALNDQALAQGVVVLADRDVESPWAKRLPQGVRFLEFGKLYRGLSENDQEQLLTRWLLQTAPDVVHNINSHLGYRVFTKYGAALRRASRLYCLVFCDNYTPEGQVYGYLNSYLPRCFEYLTAVFSDNQRIFDDLERLFALDRAKMFVHYQPLSIPLASPRRPTAEKRERLNILWAGRLDRQKRPDLLMETARRCRDYPFHFHVYGYACLQPDVPKWRHWPNVTYHGPYDGFASLPLDQFDAYLYTAQWDGLPNVLLEAMAAGLPVVASDAGGIRELVIPGQTGYLVSPLEDVPQYVDALVAILEHPTEAALMTRNAQQLLRERHSTEAFLERLLAAPGYALPPARSSDS